MHCHCQKRALYAEKVVRQEEAITLLEQLVEKEKEAHLQEMRAVRQSFQLFAREKEAMCRKYEETILKLGKKVDQYKEKICSMSEKVKENSNTIKALMDKKLYLECQNIKMRESVDKQKQQRLEQAKYTSQLKQVVALQDIQNHQLTKALQRHAQEIAYLQKQIANFSEVNHKFANIDQISEEQYHKEISLLKTSLQHQFCKNTNEIFTQLTKDTNQLNDTQKNFIREGQSHFARINIDEDELKKLANFVDYGKTYFQLGNEDLSLPESKKIFKFITHLVKELRQAQDQLQKQKHVCCELTQDLREKMAYFDQEIRQMSKRSCVSIQTQTVQSPKVAELVSWSNSLKLKNYELIKIISFLSRFAVYVATCLSLQSTKQRYFHFTEAILYRPICSKTNKMRPVGLAVLFISILAKKSNKSKRFAPDQRLGRENLAHYVHNQHLSNLIYTFSLREKRKIEVKNSKVEELASQKSEVNPQQRIIQILNQQNLNQGHATYDYSYLFNRFIFQIDHKYR